MPYRDNTARVLFLYLFMYRDNTCQAAHAAACTEPKHASGCAFAQLNARQHLLLAERIKMVQQAHTQAARALRPLRTQLGCQPACSA